MDKYVSHDLSSNFTTGRALRLCRWYFEVWNEPNQDAFWINAHFDTYMELYERTPLAINGVSSALKVGGPANTGSCEKPLAVPWGQEFLATCVERKLPLDFIWTHPYPPQPAISGKAIAALDGVLAEAQAHPQRFAL